MHRLIAIVATLLLSASALAHAPRASVGALPFGEPTRIEASNAARIEQAERQAEAAAPEPHALENLSRQQKTAHRAHARLKHAESARASALTHCLVLESWLFGWECASGEVIDGDPMMPATLNEYLAFNGNPTVYVDPDGRCAIPSLCAFGYARNNAERVTAMRSFANTNPTLGRTVGVATQLAAPVVAVNTGMLALEGDPTARAQVGQAVSDAGNYIAQRTITLATQGAAELMRQDVTKVATDFGETAAEMVAAGERGDYVGQGMAGTNLAGQVAAVVPVLRAATVARMNGVRARVEGTTPTTLVEHRDGMIAGEHRDNLSVSECCARCFGAGTLVMTADGLRPIEQIKVGEKVIARDEASGETGPREVKHVIVRSDREVFDLVFADEGGNEEPIAVTADHRFHTAKRGWVVSADLEIGEAIQSLDGRKLVLKSRSQQSRKAPTFNLSVDDDPNYFVGESGLWVHNCAVCGDSSHMPQSTGAPGVPPEAFEIRPEARIQMRLADPSIEPAGRLRYMAEGRQGRPKGHHASEPANSEGVLRDRFNFWLRFDYRLEGALSPENIRALRRGESPIVDDAWVSVFPEHSTFKGDQLQHHHILGTEDAIPLPRSLHIGAENTKVWHPR